MIRSVGVGGDEGDGRILEHGSPENPGDGRGTVGGAAGVGGGEESLEEFVDGGLISGFDGHDESVLEVL